MKILVEIDTDNAAFQGVLHLETIRILHVAVSCLEHMERIPGYVLSVGFERPLHDSNGNTIGFIKAVHHNEASR